MKRIILFLLTTILTFSAFAQRPYGCVTQGKTLEYTTYDADDNVTGYSVTTVKSVTGSGSDISVTCDNQIFDAGRNSITSTMESTIAYNNGEATANVGGYSGINIDVSGDKITLPSRLAVGMLLDLGKMTVSIEGISTSVTVIENEVIDREEITTDAGTFKCYVVKQTTESRVFGIKGTTTTKTWYARGVGAVKIETYVKNRINSTQILTKYE